MTAPAIEAPPTSQLVEVHFKGNRRAFYLWPRPEDPLRLQEPVIVESGRGLDLGRVSKVGEAAAKRCAGSCSGCAVGDPPATESRPAVVRRASREEIAQANELRTSEEEVRRKAIERIRSHSLDMKASDAEWQWDRAKLTIYFTAETRIDFRALVRDLAAHFRTRIELRQIGARDEAARLNGVGRCGREYCCSTWLTELTPISLALAKDQRLSLNPSQISGGCGRLLCCLKYEHEFYVAARRRFPKEGKTIRTAQGEEKVIAVDIFRERVFLRGEAMGSRIIPLVQLREELDQLGLPLSTPDASPHPAPAPRAQVQAPQPPPGVLGVAPADPKRSRRRRKRRRGRRGGGPEAAPTAES